MFRPVDAMLSCYTYSSSTSTELGSIPYDSRASLMAYLVMDGGMKVPEGISDGSMFIFFTFSYFALSASAFSDSFISSTYKSGPFNPPNQN